MTSPSRYRFRLYVAGDGSNSILAAANLRRICAQLHPAVPEIEVVDVLTDPGRAFADGVLMTPMLIRLAPLPLRRIVGTLSDPGAVQQVLDLPAEVA